jgi:hypothetical protein
MSNRNYIIPNENKRIIINANLKKPRKTVKSSNNQILKNSLALLRYWINDTFYIGRLKEFCNSREMKCQGATRILYRKLLNPVNQIVLRDIFGADVETLYIVGGTGHFYLTIKLGNKTIIIDPTFGQFVKSHDKIFVGTEEDVKHYFSNPSHLSLSADISDYIVTEGKLQPKIDYDFMKHIKNSIKSGRLNYITNEI